MEEGGGEEGEPWKNKVPLNELLYTTGNRRLFVSLGSKHHEMNIYFHPILYICRC
jgi:hypothetical protein